MTGVSESLNGALTRSGVPAHAIDVVMLGTTHFTNAVVQRRGLAPTAAVRLGLPATEALPPMVDWPPELREAIGNRYYFAHGGHEFDGRVITPLDPDELRRIARDIAKRRNRTVAITSVFSPVNTEVERQAGEIIAAAVPGAHVTLSSDIGRIGLGGGPAIVELGGCEAARRVRARRTSLTLSPPSRRRRGGKAGSMDCEAQTTHIDWEVTRCLRSPRSAPRLPGRNSL